MEKKTSKSRSKSWTEGEKVAALHIISANHSRLFGKFRGASSGAKLRDEAWHSIIDLLNALLSRLSYGEGSIDIRQLYDQYKFECVECGYHPVGMRSFSEHLQQIFHNIEMKRKLNKTGNSTVYNGIIVKPITEKQPDNFHSVSNYLQQRQSTFVETVSDSDQVTCELKTGIFSNGIEVKKTVTFKSDGSWQLKIGGSSVAIEKLGIDSYYQLNEYGMSVICDIVKRVGLCSGIGVCKTVSVSRFHILENWQNTFLSKKERRLRSLSCIRATAFNAKCETCKICQKMTVTSSVPQNESKENVSTTHNNKVSTEDFKRLIPNASEEMLKLLMDQYKNSSRHPSGRRWSKSIITVCLQLFTRSQHGYEALRASNILILPSPPLLILYKNVIKQDIGFNQQVFQWMFQEAKERGLPPSGWSGGLIFDEMSIQSDLQILKSGDIIELKGFADIGEEGNMCHTLRTGNNKLKLGTHILQLLFVGLTGFRFPVAHFATDQIQGPELFTLFWEAVDFIESYGFKVLYTCMDGAQCNRDFMHINMTDSNNFSSINLCNGSKMTFIMDFSHVVKKIRNNIIKSGDQANKGFTRNITLSNYTNVQWQMFRDAFQWDQQNCLSLNRKLTREHLYPNLQEKMRNHLAEEVLNSEMLALMREYKSSLGVNGAVLDGAIEFLEQTSTLIAIFRDKRPITHLSDTRLNQLMQVCNWFKQWKEWVDSLKTKAKYKNTISLQCLEDIQSCGMGFIELCKEVISSDPQAVVTPALINSDVVENHFNQQRSTYRGASTNPNVLEYSRAQNSIILGQTMISKKANAMRAKEVTEPYCVAKIPKVKRKSPTSDKDSHTHDKIKTIRL